VRACVCVYVCLCRYESLTAIPVCVKWTDVCKTVYIYIYTVSTYIYIYILTIYILSIYIYIYIYILSQGHYGCFLEYQCWTMHTPVRENQDELYDSLAISPRHRDSLPPVRGVGIVRSLLRANRARSRCLSMSRPELH